MAIRWAEGFETSQSLALLQELYSLVSIVGASFGTGRYGGSCLEGSTTEAFLVAGIPENDHLFWTISLGLNFDGTDEQDLLRFYDDSGGAPLDEGLIVRVAPVSDTSFQLKLVDGGTPDVEIYQTPQISMDAWHLIEMRFDFDDPGTFEVRVDQILVFQGTSQDLTAGINVPQWFRLSAKTSSPGVMKLDDFVLATSDTALPDWIGDVYLRAAFPVEDVTVQYTPSPGYAEVDDAAGEATPDATKVSATAAFKRNEYLVEPIGDIRSEIDLVELRLRQIEEESNPAGHSHSILYDGVASGTYSVAQDETEEDSAVFEAPPGTNAAWTREDLEKPFGHEVAS